MKQTLSAFTLSTWCACGNELLFAFCSGGEIWICKPTGMNQGKGIYLIRDIERFKHSQQEKEERNVRKPHKIPRGRIVQRSDWFCFPIKLQISKHFCPSRNETSFRVLIETKCIPTGTYSIHCWWTGGNLIFARTCWLLPRVHTWCFSTRDTFAWQWWTMTTTAETWQLTWRTR